MEGAKKVDHPFLERSNDGLDSKVYTTDTKMSDHRIRTIVIIIITREA